MNLVSTLREHDCSTPVLSMSFVWRHRYSNNWMEGVAGTVHEVGHALYEQGRPGGDMEDLPVSRALSMGVHESQVRRSSGVVVVVICVLLRLLVVFVLLK